MCRVCTQSSTYTSHTVRSAQLSSFPLSTHTRRQTVRWTRVNRLCTSERPACLHCCTTRSTHRSCLVHFTRLSLADQHARAVVGLHSWQNAVRKRSRRSDHRRSMTRALQQHLRQQHAAIRAEMASVRTLVSSTPRPAPVSPSSIPASPSHALRAALAAPTPSHPIPAALVPTDVGTVHPPAGERPRVPSPVGVRSPHRHARHVPRGGHLVPTGTSSTKLACDTKCFRGSVLQRSTPRRLLMLMPATPMPTSTPPARAPTVLPRRLTPPQDAGSAPCLHLSVRCLIFPPRQLQ